MTPSSRFHVSPALLALCVAAVALGMIGCRPELGSRSVAHKHGGSDRFRPKGQASPEATLRVTYTGRNLTIEATGHPVFMSDRNREWELIFRDRAGKVVGTNTTSAAPDMESPLFHETDDGRILWETISIGWGSGFFARHWSLGLSPVKTNGGAWSAARNLAGGREEGYCYYPLADQRGPHDFFGHKVENVAKGESVIVHAVLHEVSLSESRVSIRRQGNIYLTDWDHAEQPGRKHYARRAVDDFITIDLIDGAVECDP